MEESHMKKIIALGLVLGSFSTFAADYGPSGCGLGSIVFASNKSGYQQIFAATTNGTSGSQTFGISSGTSNCGEATLIDVKKFVEVNKSSLKNDIARGNGETIQSLASLMNIKNTAVFAQSLKSNYSVIFSSEDAGAINDSIINVAVANNLI